MGGDRRRRSQTKRRFRQVKNRENDQLETVDDLAHAAQFAIFPVAAVASVTIAESGNLMKAEDDNEIEVGDDDESVSGACIADGIPKETKNDNEGHDDDEADSESGDNESDDDIAEALQRMEQATAEEEANPTATASNPPRTENEVDGYKTSIQELESQLQIQLTVRGETNTAGTNNNMDVSIDDVSPAGNLKNHMVLDRTVVVESILRSPSSYQGDLGPLDEGSLLVIKKSDNNDSDKNVSKGIWIPLGRIFEVFGPVSQPLYTIRLPSPFGEKACKSNLKKTRKGVESEQGEANSCTKEGDTERSIANNKEESKKGTSPENEFSIFRRETISSSEKMQEPEENDGAIQSQSNASQRQLTMKETSDVPEDNGSPSISTIPPQSEVKNVNLTNDESEKTMNDPWANDGEYTVFLSQNKDIQVYYIQDEAKLIDTGFVLRTSGKGCDASNRYDEEILDSSEVYYSDDEKEREAKNKKKGGMRKKTPVRNNHIREQIHHQPRQRHSQQQQLMYNTSPRFSNPIDTAQHGRPTLSPPHPPQYYGYVQHPGSLPQGFHRMTDQTKPQGGFQQPSTLYQYPTESSFHRHASIPPPPPPPPPPRPNQPHPYQGTVQSPYPIQGASSIPPPPPKNPNEPPTYHY